RSRAWSRLRSHSRGALMAVRIRWQPPLVLEERKKVQWEKIIRSELGEIDDSLDVSLRFEAETLGWKVETKAGAPSEARAAAYSRTRVGDALRAAGKPALCPPASARRAGCVPSPRAAAARRARRASGRDRRAPRRARGDRP